MGSTMVIYRYSSGAGTFTMQQGVAYIYVYVYGFTLLEQIGTHIRGVERIYWLGREDSSG